MSFASPVFFWALLSLVPLAAIYLLKVRPVRKPTTAWFLWEDIFQENKATSLFQRFRDLFSLLLMMAAVLAVVFAMTRPNFSGDQQKDLILLIDNSASMNAVDGSGVRIERAKVVATDIIKALNGTQRCSVATVSNQIKFLSNLTDNPRELLLAVEKVQPSSMVSDSALLAQLQDKNAKEAEPVGESETGKSSRIILISDGCFNDTLPDSIELLKVGDDKKGNVGIVACDMRRLPGGRNRVGVFFQVASSFKKTVEAELTFSAGMPDALTKFIPLTVKPGLNPPEVFELEDAEAGKWFAQLDVFPADALKEDNTAYISLPPRRPIPISVVAEERYFYESCVEAFSNEDGLLTLAEKPNEETQLLIGVGQFAIPENYGGDMLMFQPKGESPFWNDAGEEIEVVGAQAVDPNHPAIRHIDATLLPFVGARRISAPAGAEILVKADDETPLIWRATSSGRSAIVLNFDPLASDFYFSAWFPVVVYSSATHLAGRTDQLPASWRTGQLATIEGVDDGEMTSVTMPDGAKLKSQTASFGPLESTGFYELNNRGGDWIAGCSLLSTKESLIDNSGIEETAQPINKGSSPAAWLTLIAVAVLAIESVLYQRRKVG